MGSTDKPSIDSVLYTITWERLCEVMVPFIMHAMGLKKSEKTVDKTRNAAA